MVRIRTILFGVFILSLVVAGCATGPVNPAGDWEKVKSKNTIEGYSDFLKNYSTSEFAPEARKKFKVVIRETALNSVGGNRAAVRKGEDFPFNLFVLDDLLKAFAQPNLPVNVTVLSKAAKEQPMKRSEISEDLKNFKAWESYYTQLLKNQKDATESIITIAVWMMPFSVTAISTSSPDTSVTFYRDPSAINDRAFGISMKKEMVRSSVEKERITMTGVGMAIIKSSGFIWVYDFSQDGKSLFNE